MTCLQGRHRAGPVNTPESLSIASEASLRPVSKPFATSPGQSPSRGGRGNRTAAKGELNPGGTERQGTAARRGLSQGRARQADARGRVTTNHRRSAAMFLVRRARGATKRARGPHSGLRTGSRRRAVPRRDRLADGLAGAVGDEAAIGVVGVCVRQSEGFEPVVGVGVGPCPAGTATVIRSGAVAGSRSSGPYASPANRRSTLARAVVSSRFKYRHAIPGGFHRCPVAAANDGSRGSAHSGSATRQ